jgi:hypothetical protein
MQWLVRVYASPDDVDVLLKLTVDAPTQRAAETIAISHAHDLHGHGDYDARASLIQENGPC